MLHTGDRLIPRRTHGSMLWLCVSFLTFFRLTVTPPPPKWAASPKTLHRESVLRISVHPAWWRSSEQDKAEKTQRVEARKEKCTRHRLSFPSHHLSWGCNSFFFHRHQPVYPFGRAYVALYWWAWKGRWSGLIHLTTETDRVSVISVNGYLLINA